MRRNARSYDAKESDSGTSLTFEPLLGNGLVESENFLQMERLPTTNTSNSTTPRFDNTIEAKVEPGDTLQAMALRFQCTVADIKRLNKIDKDNEIHARKVLKIPITIHNVLLDNLPTVHMSGNNSPKALNRTDNDSPAHSRESISGLSSLIRNPLEESETVLSEKLIVASVNAASLKGGSNGASSSAMAINDIILNSKFKPALYTDEDTHTASNLNANDDNDAAALLITDILDDSTNVPKMHRIRGPPLGTLDWSGSDCDMSWVCLFVLILALCFVIPLVYVFYIAEHHHNSTLAATHH